MENQVYFDYELLDRTQKLNQKILESYIFKHESGRTSSANYSNSFQYYFLGTVSTNHLHNRLSAPNAQKSVLNPLTKFYAYPVSKKLDSVQSVAKKKSQSTNQLHLKLNLTRLHRNFKRKLKHFLKEKEGHSYDTLSNKKKVCIGTFYIC